MIEEGYGLASFRKDMLAALTVAIVALPLSMAIAVASGVSPERGLYAAVIGGFLVSALGGSRYQIGGPAGAFIVLVAATVARFGLEGLLLTVFISGFMLTLIGLLRLGSLIRYIPHAVTIGFTCGIAVTIFASQLRDLGGLKLACRRTRAVVAKARRARPGVADAQSCCARRRHWLGRPDLPAAATGAELAGNVDRGRPGLGRRLAVASAGGDDRQPFWPASGRPAGAASADDLLRDHS